jgi:Xaa-Pro aminopeptidase
MNALDRVASLRHLMIENNIDAYIINGNDPHLSEYVPERWRTREWLSCFTGSYGRVVVTLNKSALWTDSRYFIQAEKELKGSEITLIKDRQPDTIQYEDWILTEVPPNRIVGINGLTISASEERKLSGQLTAKGIVLKKDLDLVSQIWTNRPPLPDYTAYDYDVKFAGITRREKIDLILQKLNEKSCEATIITMLDDLAWTFNLRGNDIEYNPLVTGYGYIDKEEAIIFIDSTKITVDLKTMLVSEGIALKEYKSFIPFLQALSSKTLYIDPDRTNSFVTHTIQNDCKLVEGLSIPTLLKSVKNECEITGMREAHKRDGIAMINLLYWLESNVGKVKISELDVCEKLKEFRSKQEYYKGESFYSIVGFAEHGAIVHYHVNEETNSVIEPRGLLLIDSGGQYLDGTTDITRTIALGEVSEQQRKDFTLVLKGMIQLVKAIFPYQTRGSSLDILARKALWDNCLNYGHGTGHGVGHFLCVHEGPVSIRQELNQETIREGNILSNEPGIYREGEYGIRIENLILCRKEKETKFGSFLSFDTLTLCPIDKKLINVKLLSNEEIAWLNDYHNRIVAEISSYLEPDVLEWLKIHCSPI